MKNTIFMQGIENLNDNIEIGEKEMFHQTNNLIIKSKDDKNTEFHDDFYLEKIQNEYKATQYRYFMRFSVFTGIIQIIFLSIFTVDSSYAIYYDYSTKRKILNILSALYSIFACIIHFILSIKAKKEKNLNTYLCCVVNFVVAILMVAVYIILNGLINNDLYSKLDGIFNNTMGNYSLNY